MDKFAEILKDLIEEKGLSLRKIAQASGVSANQYSKYLTGAIPTIPVAVRISNYFEHSIDFLFGLVEDEKNLKFNNSYDLSNFISKYENLLNINKITHWKFANKYGLSESSLRHWKYGDIPKLDSLFIIALNLSTSIDYLIGRRGKV